MMVVFEIPKEVFPKVVSSAVDVISINPNSAQVMASLGLAYVHALQWEDGWRMLSKSHETNPNLALNLLGLVLYYCAMGETKLMINALEQADKLDPLNEEVAEWGMWALMMTNQLDAAIRWGETKVSTQPGKPYPILSLSVAYYLKGDFEASTSLAEKGVGINGREPLPLTLLAQSLAAKGDFTEAESLLAEVKSINQYTCPYETAVVYNMMGQTERVFSLLTQAVEFQSNCLIFARNDPRFVNLRHTPSYLAILEKIGLDDETINSYKH
ncbi:tetratricopeptide repeat protein [Paraglaciecola sp. 2405UD69-4]|uniref:tetratricopeptide repeat protein n=1 Tax=Paraglaciecola sp. 2405UD69-4 TaxID=3391836 RepID=UPI0039C97C4B